MFEVVLNKVFKDTDTNQDIYCVSIKIKNNFYTLYVTKEEFDKLTATFVSIRDNGELN